MILRFLIFIIISHLVQASPLRIVGSDLLRDVIKESSLSQLNREVSVTLDGSSLALEDIKSNNADIAIIALPQDISPPADNLESVTFAFQIVVIAVSASNPLEEISLNQIASIYSVNQKLDITNWGAIGLTGAWQGRNISINSVSNAPGVGLELIKYTVLKNAIMKPLIKYWDNPNELVNYLSNDLSAIAVLPSIPNDNSIKVLSLSKKDGEYSFSPTLENISFGDYPIRMPFYLVYNKDRKVELNSIFKILYSNEIADKILLSNLNPLPESVRKQRLEEY